MYTLSVIVIISFLVGMIIMDIIISSNTDTKKIEIEKKKWQYYFSILNMWLDLKQQNKGIVQYMKEHGYLRIAIYGASDLGNRLFSELKNSEIDVVCVIDKRNNVLGDFKLISPDDEVPSVDLLVVCAEFYFDEIKSFMKKKVNCPILSLSGLLGNAFKRNL